jgi:hypothetical protein
MAAYGQKAPVRFLPKGNYRRNHLLPIFFKNHRDWKCKRQSLYFFKLCASNPRGVIRKSFYMGPYGKTHFGPLILRGTVDKLYMIERSFFQFQQFAAIPQLVESKYLAVSKKWKLSSPDSVILITI